MEDATVMAMCPSGRGNPTNDCYSLSAGACLIGDGNNFCSFNRDGSRFSNAGNAGCAGSLADSIYWAWDTDNRES
jgi:hypothetical protein